MRCIQGDKAPDVAFAQVLRLLISAAGHVQPAEQPPHAVADIIHLGECHVLFAGIINCLIDPFTGYCPVFCQALCIAGAVIPPQDDVVGVGAFDIIDKVIFPALLIRPKPVHQHHRGPHQGQGIAEARGIGALSRDNRGVGEFNIDGTCVCRIDKFVRREIKRKCLFEAAYGFCIDDTCRYGPLRRRGA